MTHEEQCGADSLEEIYRVTGSFDIDAVVRWCPQCGAVVIDEDYDGRTKPGAIAPIRFPSGQKITEK